MSLSRRSLFGALAAAVGAVPFLRGKAPPAMSLIDAMDVCWEPMPEGWPDEPALGYEPGDVVQIAPTQHSTWRINGRQVQRFHDGHMRYYKVWIRDAVID